MNRRIGLVGEDSDGRERGPVVDLGVEEAPGLVGACGRSEMEDLHSLVMPKFQWQSDFGTLIKLQGDEGELEGNGVEEVEDNVLVRVQVGPYPDLRDTALHLVLLCLKLGLERLEVFLVEQECTCSTV
ncbi:hypothetical protein FH972_012709 [Carpinus fangiana]|uniref:Uncharacterized protein n=1 Tax=Carpinus fangiana TaxID=176857 RepID=A0A5N6R7U4_9ROSI|nr:hypothetical protein FH972_012709 [Carpinus fangiana]